MAAKFKLVPYGIRYHVIGYTGVKRKDKNKSTYKEQCFSSHYTIKQAQRAIDKYEKAGLELSSKVKHKRSWAHWSKEWLIGLIIAIVCGIVYEVAHKQGWFAFLFNLVKEYFL